MELNREQETIDTYLSRENKVSVPWESASHAGQGGMYITINLHLVHISSKSSPVFHAQISSRQFTVPHSILPTLSVQHTDLPLQTQISQLITSSQLPTLVIIPPDTSRPLHPGMKAG